MVYESDTSYVEPVQLTDEAEKILCFSLDIPSDLLSVKPPQGLERTRGEEAA